MDIGSTIYVRKIININSSPNILKIKEIQKAAKADPMEIFIKGQKTPLNGYIDNFTFHVNWQWLMSLYYMETKYFCQTHQNTLEMST